MYSAFMYIHTWGAMLATLLRSLTCLRTLQLNFLASVQKSGKTVIENCIGHLEGLVWGQRILHNRNASKEEHNKVTRNITSDRDGNAYRVMFEAVSLHTNSSKRQRLQAQEPSEVQPLRFHLQRRLTPYSLPVFADPDR